MGNWFSSPSPPPSPPPPPKPTLLDEPWRYVPRHKETLDFVKSRNFKKYNVNHLRILLHGPAGAGKSSFINSVNSVLRGEITGRALADARSAASFTREYKSYKIPCAAGSDYSLSFTDIMGFEKNENNGISVEDVVLALKGHMAEGYTFNPSQPLTEDDPKYNRTPTRDDRVHILVSVFPADSVTLFGDQVLEKMRDVRLKASRMGIPQFAVLTKVDEACPDVKKKTDNMYRSIYLKDKVDYLNVTLGLQRNCIFLVKNYESEIDVSAEVDEPILCALRQMIIQGEDFVSNM